MSNFKLKKAGAGIVAATMLLSLAPFAGSAFAAETGSITVNNVAGQPDTVTYKAIQIFTADVANGKASNIAWATGMQAKVEAAIRAYAGTHEATAEEATASGGTIQQGDPIQNYTGTTAQEAAEYIIAHMSGTDTTTRLASDSFGEALARALKNEAGTELTAGTRADGIPEGYVLVLSTGTPNAGTSPIFATIANDAPVTITEKTGVPTIDKKVKEDSNSTWQEANDADFMQENEFLITGTLSENLVSFDTYSYEFADTTTGLVIDPDSIVVKYGAADSTYETAARTLSKVTAAEPTPAELKAGYVVTMATNNKGVNIKFADLKTAVGNTISNDGKVYVYYKAKMSKDAPTSSVLAPNPNENKVSLKYSRDPQSGEEGQTEEKQTQTYSYEFDITKEDSAVAGRKLEGVKFTISGLSSGLTVKPETAGAKGAYVVCDANDSAKLSDGKMETDANGKITIKGLDAGQYTLTETDPRDGYQQEAPFTIVIGTALTENPTTHVVSYDTSADSKFRGKTSATDETHLTTITGGSAESHRSLTSADPASGKVEVKLENVKENNLPATGQAGIALSLIGGAILIGGGIYIGIRRTRKEK